MFCAMVVENVGFLFLPYKLVGSLWSRLLEVEWGAVGLSVVCSGTFANW